MMSKKPELIPVNAVRCSNLDRSFRLPYRVPQWQSASLLLGKQSSGFADGGAAANGTTDSCQVP